MSVETAFLAALADYLRDSGRLLPAPATVGVVEPVAAGDLPAVVLSLKEVRRPGAGLGERASLVTGGALPVSARIDLANPVLPEETTFRLLSDDRRTLVLPHGGWVKADATTGLLSSVDLQISVAGVPRTVVNAEPGAGEVRPDALVGTLLFGAALPAAGIVEASYFLGQWERRVTPIAGELRVDVRALVAADLQAISDALIDTLDAGAPLPRGLRKIALHQLSSVGPVGVTLANSRGRSLYFTFDYEHELDRPESSGGVIRRIPIHTRLASTTVDKSSGAIVTTLISEVDP